MAFTRNWSDGTPLGSEQASDLDTFIQNVRGDISDRIKNMVYGFVAGENSLSQHFQYLQFYEQASVAQPSAGYGRVYCKAVGGKCELFWQDEDGDEIQLTTGGNFGGGNLELLAGMDLLGSSTSDITINTNKFTVAGATGNTVIAGTLTQQGVATLADTSALATSGAPAADAQIANKKYVDTKESILVTQATAGIFGAWTDKDSGGSNALANTEIYKVGSDGFVICYSTTSPGTELTIHTDGSNPPGTKRVSSFGSGTGSINFGFCPIRKDDYFEVNNAATGKIYWLPIGSGTCVKQ